MISDLWRRAALGANSVGYRSIYAWFSIVSTPSTNQREHIQEALFGSFGGSSPSHSHIPPSFGIASELSQPCGSSGPCLFGGLCLPSSMAPCSLCFSGWDQLCVGPPDHTTCSKLPSASVWQLPHSSSPSVTSAVATSTRLSRSPTWLAPRCPCFVRSSTSVLSAWEL